MLLLCMYQKAECVRTESVDYLIGINDVITFTDGIVSLRWLSFEVTQLSTIRKLV